MISDYLSASDFVKKLFHINCQMALGHFDMRVEGKLTYVKVIINLLLLL